MELLIVTGFLGSGKTTLILSIARRLIEERGKRVVIIENEAGDVGIDGQYLERSGLMVQELYTGCVCCQLAGYLIKMLDSVEDQFRPDIVMVEPSGVARLESLLEVLKDYAHKVDGMRTLSLIDILRFDILMKVVSPLITSHVINADLVALNKTENVDKQEVDRVVKALNEIKGDMDVDILPVSATQGINIDSLFNRLME